MSASQLLSTQMLRCAQANRLTRHASSPAHAGAAVAHSTIGRQRSFTDAPSIEPPSQLIAVRNYRLRSRLLTNTGWLLGSYAQARTVSGVEIDLLRQQQCLSSVYRGLARYK